MKNSTEASSSENLNPERKEHLKKVLTQFSNVMFMTVAPDGALGIRPMAILKCTDEGILWFIASTDSTKVEDITSTGNVFVTGQSGSSLFFAAKCKASIHVDRETRDKLWTESLKVWFPNGKEDQSVCFIRVEVIEGEYWDTTGLQKVAYFMEAVKAYVTGKKAELSEVSQHGITKLENSAI